MKPPSDSERLTAEQNHEETARQLKQAGYNASVVALKMIRQHNMTEEAATALVGKTFGKKVSARTGDTTFAVLSGVGLVAAGVLAMLVMLWLRIGLQGWVYWLLSGPGFVGTGLTRIFIALVNVNAKDDLRERRD